MDKLKDRIAAAKAFLKAGNHAAAEREVSEILKADPGNFQARVLLFESALERGDVDRAFILSKRLVSEYPDFPVAHVHFLQMLLIKGKLNEAREHLARCRNRFGDVVAWEGFERHLELLAGNVEKARKLLENDHAGGLAHEEEENERLFFKARLLMAECRYDEAIEMADQLVARQPDYPEIRALKVFALFRAGRFSAARSAARELRALDPASRGGMTELIIASWLVFFPPFYLAHLMRRILEYPKVVFRGRMGTAASLVPLLGMSYVLGRGWLTWEFPVPQSG